MSGAEGSTHSRSATSKPSTSGSWTSRRMKSGRSSCAARMADSPVLGLAHDLVTLELEQPARGSPEPGVVVDDENGFGHRGSVVPDTRFPQADTL